MTKPPLAEHLGNAPPCPQYTDTGFPSSPLPAAPLTMLLAAVRPAFVLDVQRRVATFLADGGIFATSRHNGNSVISATCTR